MVFSSAHASETIQLDWAITVVIILATFSVACTAFSMLLTFLFSNRASFVFSQPSFLSVLLVGILLLQMSQFFLALSLSDARIYSGASASCRAYLWLFWVGCSLSLSAQCARLYRALLVFRERSLRRPKLSTTKFFLSLAALCMIPMGLVLIRMVTDPVQIDQGICLPLEVASNPNTVVLGLFVRLSVWGLLAVCYWFTRILQKLGATVDDAKTQTKLFFWLFFADGTITGMQTAGIPPDHVAILLASAIAFGTITALHAVFSVKLARVGLNSKEMLLTLRREKEIRELNAIALKLRPVIKFPWETRCCGKKRKEGLLELREENPHLEIPPSSRAPRGSIAHTAEDGEFHDDEGLGRDPFYSDVILASMTSRPVSRMSLRLNTSNMASNNPGAHTSMQSHVHPAGDAPAGDQTQRISQQHPPILQQRSDSAGANDVFLASINQRSEH